MVPNGSSYVFKNCSSGVKFYVIGADNASMVSQLKAQSGGNYMAITDDDIVLDYNKCAAFYGSEHDYVNANDPTYCKATCSRCKVELDGTTAHSFVISESFESGKYISACSVNKACSSCQYDAGTTDVGAIIVWIGYSVPEKPIGDTVGISQSFKIDRAELSK